MTLDVDLLYPKS